MKKLIETGGNINLRDANDLLGWKSDSETERYERQYLQEVPLKDNCQIM